MTGRAERQALRDTVLEAALPNVAFDGWTDRSLRDGALAAGLDAGAAIRAFPGGAKEAIGHFSDWADRRMLAALEDEAESFGALRVRDRITRAVRLRLELLAPHREALRRALTLLGLRPDPVFASRLLYRTVDAMWRAAGDTATDFNFYTKRGLLAGVQSATVLFWLGDRSADNEATWAFLDRRIGNVMTIGKAIGQMKGRTGTLPSPLGLATRLRDAAAGRAKGSAKG
ncbi:MAG: COQ9 family protein [Inquilinus sp.]|nr:COQ9 family protein [Inquilinus sp.]